MTAALLQILLLRPLKEAGFTALDDLELQVPVPESAASSLSGCLRHVCQSGSCDESFSGCTLARFHKPTAEALTTVNVNEHSRLNSRRNRSQVDKVGFYPELLLMPSY